MARTKKGQAAAHLDRVAKALVEMQVSRDLWDGFLDHRRKLRKPMTEYAQVLAMMKLWELRKTGNDPVAVIQQSILAGWQGLFEVHGQTPPSRQWEQL